MKFEKAKIGALCDLITKGTTPTTQGHRYTDSGVSFVKVESLTEDGRIDPSKLAYIDPSTHEALKRSQLRSGDILFTIAGTIGRVGKVPDTILPANTNQAVALLRPNSDLLDRDFLLYSLRQLVNEGKVASGVVQAVQANFSLGSIRELELSIPSSIDSQRQVVGTLCLIDTKIDVNRRINQTLEAMAQAIFKSWFVDFDPVKAKIAAKAEGRDPLRAAMTAISGKLDAELDTLPPDQFAPLAATAALFPDEMEDSELGEIPKGWCCDTFGSIAELSKGSVNPLLSPERVFEHFSLPAFDAGKQPVVEEGAQIKSNKTKFARGAVLQSKLNPHIPRVWFPLRVSENAVCSTEFLPWIAKEPASPSFLYCLLTSDPFGVQVRSLVTGTSNSHQRVKPDQVSGLLTVVPPKDLLSAFTKTVDPFFERVESGTSQMRDLASLRDALLPKLLSGELHVRGAEAEAAA